MFTNENLSTTKRSYFIPTPCTAILTKDDSIHVSVNTESQFFFIGHPSLVKEYQDSGTFLNTDTAYIITFDRQIRFMGDVKPIIPITISQDRLPTTPTAYEYGVIINTIYYM